MVSLPVLNAFVDVQSVYFLLFFIQLHPFENLVCFIEMIDEEDKKNFFSPVH